METFSFTLAKDGCKIPLSQVANWQVLKVRYSSFVLILRDQHHYFSLHQDAETWSQWTGIPLQQERNYSFVQWPASQLVIFLGTCKTAPFSVAIADKLESDNHFFT